MSNAPDSSVRFVLRYRSRTAQQYLEDLGNGVTLEMLKIPGGTFQMGSLPDEPERLDTEGPQHPVTVSDFFLGRYPITQAQWRAICDLPPVDPEVVLNPNPSHFTKDFREGETTISADQRPVEKVSWVVLFK
ncbi:MAG: hypothetical protein Fur0042_19800 [Cyanophyceae cyanobacterium]